MEQEQCRLCGKTMELTDLLEINFELQNMIEYHCRLELNLSDMRFPSKMCFDCNYTLENFSKFTEDIKETQMKFSALFQDIKIEIDELPALIERSKSPDIFLDEPKVEIDEDDDMEIKPFGRKTRNLDEIKKVKKHFKIEESDEDLTTTESDSDYQGNKYYKRKRPVKHRRVRMKRKKAAVAEGDEEFDIFEEVPESDRYKNGTLKKKSLSLYEGKTWNDLKVGCVECDQFANGPLELRQHHFKFHSLDSQYKCSECVDHNDVNFSYFYQFLNHYPEHLKHLKFCCVSSYRHL